MSRFITVVVLLLGVHANAEQLRMKVQELPDQEFLQTLSTTGVLGQDCSQGVAPGAMGESANPTPSVGSDDPLAPISMIVDSIINIGKKIWAIVELGRPVVNVRTDVATALPQGARCWLDLQGWSAPTSHHYQVAFENAYGVEVVRFEYRVISVAGGSVNGVGKYVGYASIQPVDLQVSWGFNFSAQAIAPAVYNMGTKQEPVGGLQLEMNYKISTPVTDLTQSQAYFVDGLGNYKAL